MSRIAYNTPMIAYDHIASMLGAVSSKDGIVSRDDAKALVKNLRKEGRGAEAQAASNLFKIIDSRDNSKGARVTGYDLKASRSFVQEKMLEGYDANKNGWSEAEMAKMSPTGKGLIQLGQALKMSKTGGRLSYATPEKGMAHVAKLINAAGGKDGVTSRDDMKKLGDTLYKAGRWAEGQAVRYFYNFTDHRDFEPGARVTTKDVARAVEYSGTHLLRSKDGNKDGYSAAEQATFSTTAKAFVMVGKMIEAGIIG
jgi:hypothetical protein